MAQKTWSKRGRQGKTIGEPGCVEPPGRERSERKFQGGNNSRLVFLKIIITIIVRFFLKPSSSFPSQERHNEKLQIYFERLFDYFSQSG